MASRLELDMAAVVTALGAGAAPHVFGVQELSKRASPPRVVWARGRASFEAPSIRCNTEPRPLLAMKPTVEMHMWARTDEELEALIANEIVGLARIANASYTVEGFEPGAVNEEWVRLGFCGVLTASIMQSVDDEVTPVGQVDRFEQDPVWTPGGSDAWLESGDVAPAPYLTFDSATKTITRTTGDWSAITTPTFSIAGTEDNDGIFTVDSTLGNAIVVLESLTDEQIRISQVTFTTI